MPQKPAWWHDALLPTLPTCCPACLLLLQWWYFYLTYTLSLTLFTFFGQVGLCWVDCRGCAWLQGTKGSSTIQRAAQLLACDMLGRPE